MARPSRAGQRRSQRPPIAPHILGGDRDVAELRRGAFCWIVATWRESGLAARARRSAASQRRTDPARLCEKRLLQFPALRAARETAKRLRCAHRRAERLAGF